MEDRTYTLVWIVCFFLLVGGALIADHYPLYGTYGALLSAVGALVQVYVWFWKDP